MRVIGVIDLLDGLAVHARAGNRTSYAPVRAIAGSPLPAGDTVALARAYVDRFGLCELYVADLDAILGKPPQHDVIRALSALPVTLGLDAGVSSVEQARRASDSGASYVIVGLETLSTFAALDEICLALGGEQVAFSLDLREGNTIGAAGFGLSTVDVAARAVQSGATALIVLDLARVGMATGPDFDGIATIRRRAPDVRLIAGGGVRSREDLVRLADCGCDAALVATALQNGQLSAGDVRFVPRRPGWEKSKVRG
jgi:phosphoribosylformimino-5-aminoimidazole carboxamide ribotide isomerase